MTKLLLHVCVLLLAVSAVAAALVAGPVGEAKRTQWGTTQTYMIPMRDGMLMHTQIDLPLSIMSADGVTPMLNRTVAACLDTSPYLCLTHILSSSWLFLFCAFTLHPSLLPLDMASSLPSSLRKSACYLAKPAFDRVHLVLACCCPSFLCLVLHSNFFAAVDMRGTKKSQGKFTIWHSAAEDAFDTMQWLAAQVSWLGFALVAVVLPSPSNVSCLR